MSGTAGSEQFAIEARNLGVAFDLRLSRHRTLRRTIGELVQGRNGDGRSTFWALRDVSFGVGTGELLGVVGRNGSGKSTLLLTIAGTLRPDRGSIATFGNSSTLLTLGAGFEQDLTGRENIYLNGAFFGLSKRAVDGLMETIIDFSELGPFIDVPLRKYSTGMRARLGFSIAVHVEPDILLLDEVLGVGDASFKEKSRAKLEDMMSTAKALVLVTHDTAFVREICTTAIWLEQGEVAASGDPGAVVDEYLARAKHFKGPLRKTAS